VTAQPIRPGSPDGDLAAVGAAELYERIASLESQVCVLAESEKRYRMLIEHATEVIVVVQDARFVFVSPSFEQFTGRPASACSGLDIAEVIHPEDLPAAAARPAARQRGELVENQYEVRIIHVNGRVRWVSISVVPVEWNGRLASLALGSDVTERRQAQENLQKSEELYRQVVENISEGILIAQNDRLAFANPSLIAMSGYAEKQLKSASFTQLVHVEDQPRVLERHARRMRGETTEPYLEFRIICGDGSSKWIQSSAVRIDWNGAPATLAFISDLSLRRELEDRLRQSLSERESILNSALVGISFSVDRVHQWVNRTFADILGYAPEELIGRSSRIQFEDEETWERVGQDVNRMILAGKPYRAELRMVRRDGASVWVEVFGTALDPADLGRGIIWTFVDVSERRRADEESRAALAKQQELSALKARFVSMASHEFRTPLAAMLTSAQLLSRYADRLPAEEKAGIYADIETAVVRMTGLLDDILLFGRADADRLEFKPRRIDLAELCESLIEEQRLAGRVQWPGAPVPTLEFRRADRMAVVDAWLLRNILGNLLGNAVKYSRPGGRAQLEVSESDGRIRFVVSDDGIGISEADLPKLFTAFHRGSNVGEIQGTGLGLAIVRRAVTRHGGTIEVDSKPGQGSRFTVSLPLS